MFTKKYQNTARKDFKKFEDIYRFVKMHRIYEILEVCVTEVYYKEQKADKKSYQLGRIDELAKQMMIGCFISPFVGSASVSDFVTELKQNIEEYKWLYEQLEDRKSKQTLFYILRYRLFLQTKDLATALEPAMQYYIPEIFPKIENAVLVDCGAFDGQTVKDFIEVYGDYSKIYAYEPAVDNYYNCCSALQNLSDVYVKNKGVSDKKGHLAFTSHMPDAANRINPNGDIIVDVTTLDEDIDEKITFIKMDIEGAEQAAISGAKRHIANDAPQLAICLYHTIEDIWKIPKLIYQINPNYKFYMRYHDAGSLIAEEIVLYAEPSGSTLSGNPLDTATKKQITEILVLLKEAVDYISVAIEKEPVNIDTILDVWNNIEPLVEGIVLLANQNAKLLFEERVQPVINDLMQSFNMGKNMLENGHYRKAGKAFNLETIPLFERTFDCIIEWIEPD